MIRLNFFRGAACTPLLLVALAGCLAVSQAKADTLLSTTIYSSPGADTYTVPTNATYLIVKVWGAGGGNYGPGGFSYGGSGGLVTGRLSVTASSVYNIYVGYGGTTGSAGAANGGAPSVGNAGGGGGSSAFYAGSGIIGAGGGGGGSNGDNGWYSGGDGGSVSDQSSPTGGAGADSSNTGTGVAGGANGYSGFTVTSYSSLTGSAITADAHWASPAALGAGYYDFTGKHGRIVVLAYAQGDPAAVTSSTAQRNVLVNQSTSYTITGSNGPTSYGASGLPTGLSVNTSNGAITGTPTVAGSYTSTISVTNAYGTGTATLVWKVASIVTNGSVSPSSTPLGTSVTLTRDGSANFGLAWTENVIWKPSGAAEVLGNMQLGSQSYTPTGAGNYAYQFRVVDIYSNYRDQWINFTVSGLPAPTGFSATAVQSTSVALGWNAVTGATGYNVYRNGVKLNSSLLTGTSYTDSTAQPGTTYTYMVKAVASDGSESSSSINVTTASAFELFTPLS